MLKTFSLRGREAALVLHGPRGSRRLFHDLRRLVGTLTYEIDVVELGHGDVVTRSGYRVTAFRTDHGVDAIGYALEEDGRPGRFDAAVADALGVPDGPPRGALQRGEPVALEDGTVVSPDAVVGPPRRGRKLVLTGDTAPCTSVVDAAAGADLLVHEATFLADERERARETHHSTAGEAALAARAAGVRLLALTHVSARYSGRQLEEEARQVFEATIVPRDFDLVEIPLPERGEPVHLPRGGRTGRHGGMVSEA
jgi:ribonuclease Z